MAAAEAKQGDASKRQKVSETEQKDKPAAKADQPEEEEKKEGGAVVADDSFDRLPKKRTESAYSYARRLLSEADSRVGEGHHRVARELLAEARNLLQQLPLHRHRHHSIITIKLEVCDSNSHAWSGSV